MHRLFAALLLLSCSCFAQSRPNIIFFLVDDLGYGDLGCFWQDQRASTKKFDTPALDHMAAEGAKLTHHYVSASVCAPSRASLLLGRHQGHCNVRDSQFDKALADNHTIASVLKAAGYRTIHLGKNGLAGGESSTALTGTGSQNLAAHPLDRGFDRFFGYLFHADGHEHYPTNGTTDKAAHIYDDYRQVTDASVDLYTTDAWTAAAKKEIIAEATDGDNQPFFIYLAYDTPHFKMQRPAVAYPALDTDGDPLTGGIQWTTATDGAGKVRYASTANGSGVVDAYTHPDIPSAWGTSEKQHVGMIRRIDDSVADILRTLQDLGIDGNTICVFSSDNGPHNEGNNPRTFESYANMEGIKRDLWEAGIRAPTIVRWPGHIAGATNDGNNIHEIAYPSALWDWMPTFCELAEIPAPAWCDGVSLVPTLTGSGTQRDKGYLYFEFQNGGSTPTWAEFPNHGGTVQGQMQCVRIGDRMGVRTGITTGTESFRIYEVTTDPGQATNLAASLPEVQAQMQYLALTARRPGGGVSRPYDGLPLPAAGPPSAAPGVSWRSYTDAGATWQWVPEFRDLTAGATGTATGIDLSVRPTDDHFGLLFTGYINVPAAGSYTFYVNSDTGADFFLHDGHLIDDDFNHSGTADSGAVNLSAGLHPFRLYYRHATGARTLGLDWSGPGLSRQPVPSSAFLIEAPSIPGPPVANDDSATTAFETSVLIDVLANDTDDGTPGPLAIQSVGTPDFGAAVEETGKVRYTPPAGFSGVATFGYTVTDGADTDSATVAVTVQPALTGTLWTTTFSGSDGNGRALTNTNGDALFTDTLSADDFNLTFEDTSFSGTVFMHSNEMASGAYFSPRTNVDNPAAASPQNGGWWQTEFRYAGGSQTVNLSAVAFTMLWSNSSGDIQTTSTGYGTTIRDITLTAEYSLDGGTNWLPIASPQTYDLTEPVGQDQVQVRTFTPASPITVDHATQNLWLRVRAENAGGTTGAYVDIKSIGFKGNVVSQPVVLWTTTFSGSDGTDRALANTVSNPSFTDTLAAADANLAFQDTSFTGTVFMHSGSMSAGNHYSPRTNVDNPGAASPQNGGWWQTEFRYTGGSQTISLESIIFDMLWTNSSGNRQNGDAIIRDITLSVDYSLDGGSSWSAVSAAQTYNVTVPPPATALEQYQDRIFTPASPLTVDHATQDLWLRVRAANAGGTAGAYVDIRSIAFKGIVSPPADDYANWAAGYPGANLANPNADEDGDGLTNNEERIWGLDPTKGTSANPFVIPLDAAAGTFTYSRRNPALTGIAYHYQWSDTLGLWHDFSPASEIPGGTTPAESVAVTIPAGLLGGAKLFVRVVATQN